MKAEKIKSSLVERALQLATLPTVGLEQPPSSIDDLTEGRVRAVRGQRTEWHNLRIDAGTTGILICSTVLDADIWLALREDFEPDPELPSFAVFYRSEIPLLRDKSADTLRKIHQARLVFNGGRVGRF
jgi:hypothetical protein